MKNNNRPTRQESIPFTSFGSTAACYNAGSDWSSIVCVNSLWQTVLIITRYKELLEAEFAQAHPDTKRDTKKLSHKKTIMDYEAFYILLFLWKESAFVSDEEISAMNVQRIFSGPISKYRIATTIHGLDNSRSLASYKHNINVVMQAAEFIGLVKLEKTHVNDSRIIVQPMLDDFMRNLAT